MKRGIILLGIVSILILGISVISAENCVDECQRGSDFCINDTNYRVCGNYDSDSCLELVDAIPCNNGEVCRVGECVNLSKPNLCNDSDGGLNFYEAGYLGNVCPSDPNHPGGGCGAFFDICINKTTLVEYSCNKNYSYQNSHETSHVLYDCPEGCVKGACINDSKKENNETLVGNDSDIHGCKGSAGYSWCEEKQKCLRTWEENCSSLENQTLPGKDKVKILPETASQIAKERLGDLGFIVVEKFYNNDGAGGYYLMNGEKEGKLFGLFKVKGKVSAEVDFETGEITKVHKPWWGFMAGV